MVDSIADKLLEPIRQTRVVEWRLTQPRILPVALLMSGAILAALLHHVYVQVKILETGYEISRGVREQEQLLDHNRTLRAEFHALTDLSEVEKAAKRLGMGQAEKVIWLD
ncbi:MAG: Cell division protein FtsL [Myxococcota bacterium]|nr:Cell division protein FtsL [Myxococcota bacterium]